MPRSRNQRSRSRRSRRGRSRRSQSQSRRNQSRRNRSRRNQSRQNQSRRNQSRRNRSRRNRRSPRYIIRLPPVEQCTRKRSPKRIQTYCGTKTRLPSGYTRRGTQYECLKKGFGTGRCSVYLFTN